MHRTGIGVLRLDPNVARAGGPQIQGAESAAVVHLLRTLDNTESGALRPNPTLQKPEGTIAKAERVKP